MTWDGPTAAWWSQEVADDEAYVRDVDPLLRHLMPSASEGPVLDVGCGTGRLSDLADVGVDASIDLLRAAAPQSPVVAADVAEMPFGDASAGGAFAVLVLEHLPDPAPFFEEAARVIAPGGWLIAIVNHPLWTPRGAGPFVDPVDDEVLWRWGDYLRRGHTDEPAGGVTAAVPSTNAEAAVPHESASTTWPPWARSTTEPPAALRPPL